MVGFSEYFESIIHQKPEWRKAFITYETTHAFLLRLGIMTQEVNEDYSHRLSSTNVPHHMYMDESSLNSPSGILPASPLPTTAGDGRRECGHHHHHHHGDDDHHHHHRNHPTLQLYQSQYLANDMIKSELFNVSGGENADKLFRQSLAGPSMMSSAAAAAAATATAAAAASSSGSIASTSGRSGRGRLHENGEPHRSTSSSGGGGGTTKFLPASMDRVREQIQKLKNRKRKLQQAVSAAVAAVNNNSNNNNGAATPTAMANNDDAASGSGGGGANPPPPSLMSRGPSNMSPRDPNLLLTPNTLSEQARGGFPILQRRSSASRRGDDRTMALLDGRSPPTYDLSSSSAFPPPSSSSGFPPPQSSGGGMARSSVQSLTSSAGFAPAPGAPTNAQRMSLGTSATSSPPFAPQQSQQRKNITKQQRRSNNATPPMSPSVSSSLAAVPPSGLALAAAAVIDQQQQQQQQQQQRRQQQQQQATDTSRSKPRGDDDDDDDDDRRPLLSTTARGTTTSGGSAGHQHQQQQQQQQQAEVTPILAPTMPMESPLLLSPDSGMPTGPPANSLETVSGGGGGGAGNNGTTPPLAPHPRPTGNATTNTASGNAVVPASSASVASSSYLPAPAAHFSPNFPRAASASNISIGGHSSDKSMKENKPSDNNNNNNDDDTAENGANDAKNIPITYVDVYNMCIETIESDADRASLFAEQSQVKLSEYFEEHYRSWSTEGDNADPQRAKTHIRYLYHELQQLANFIEANKLCAIKLIREFQSATDDLLCEAIDESLLLIEPDEVEVSARLERCEDVVLATIRDIESFFATNFCGGDLTKSQKAIQTKTQSPTQAFRAGFLLALCVATILYWCHVFFELGVDSNTQKRFDEAFPVIRFCHTLAFWAICWSAVLWGFQRFNVNYLYVFELSSIASVTWLQMLEFALFVMWFTLFLGILYVRSSSVQEYYASSAGFTNWTPAFIPLMLGIFIVCIVYPPRLVLRERTRNSFFTIFLNVLKLPWGWVNFAQFTFADVGTSLNVTMADLLYTFCYTGTFVGHITSIHGTNLPSMEHCTEARKHWGNLAASLPFMWRAMQTFKMYHRTNNKVHLINHGKYIVSLIYFWIAVVKGFYPDSEHVIIAAWFFKCFYEGYSLIWDILMDWGFVQGRGRRLLLPEKFQWWYYFAMVADAAMRYFFLVEWLVLTPAMGGAWAAVIAADVEILRRAVVWAYLRVELETINNLETYRSIDFVPKVTLPPLDED